MELQRVVEYINQTCSRSKHEEDHIILPIPGRDDVCFAFCMGWGNRLFLVWERDSKLHHEEIAGASAFQVGPVKETIVLDGTIVRIHVSVENWIGSSGGAELCYDLGKPEQAQPVATQFKQYCIGVHNL